MARLTFWFEFASTYSYLSTMRIADLAQAAGVDLMWRPFLLGPIFAAQGWYTSPFNLYPAKGRYMWRDMDRRAARLGLPPVTRPDPFPQNGLLPARVATLGMEDGWGEAFARGVFSAQFAERRNIGDSSEVAAVVTALGLAGDEIVARARTDQTIKDRLRATTEAAQALGIFGAPSFTTADGELFWGDDQLEAALDWAVQTAGSNA